MSASVETDNVEHLRAEIARSHDEAEQSRRVLDTAPLLLWSRSPDGRLTFCNQRCAEYTGLTRETLLSEGWQENIHPEDRERVLQQWKRAFESGIGFESEHRVRRADGVYRWFLCLFSPVRNPAGKILQWVGSAVDIDDRIAEHKTAEDKLRKSEERFRLAQQVASIGTFEWNIQTGVDRWSPELEALYGLEAGTFPGTHQAWEFLVYPDDRAAARRQVEEAIENGSFEGEWRIIRPDGTLRWLAGRAWVFRDPSGRPLRMIGINIDVTERKCAEDELRQNRNMLAHVLDSVPQSVFWKDRNSVYLGCNEVFARAVGIASPEQIVGKTDADLPWPRHEAGAYRVDDMEVMESNRPKRHIVEPFQRADGTRLWVDTTKVPLCDGAGRVYGVLGVCDDITERKRADEALRHSEERFRTIFQQAPLGIALVDSRTGRFLQCNLMHAETLGRTPEEMLTLDFMSISHPDDLQNDLDQMERLRSGEIRSFQMEKRCLHADGSIVWINLTVVALWLENEEPTCHIAMVENITQRKRIALREHWRSRILEALTTGAPLGSILDLLTRAVEAEDTETLCSILLLDAEGKHLLHGSAPSLPDFYNEAVNGLEIGMGVGSCGTAAFTGKRVIVEDIQTHPYWARYRDPPRRAGLRSSWSEPILSSHGQVLGTFAMYHRQPRSPSAEQIQLIQYASSLASVAIERKRADEALVEARAAAESANHAKDQFLAVLSHELRTPLMPVLATVAAMESEEGLPPETHDEVAIIRRNVEMEARLIDDLLDVTRISRGKIELHREVVDVHACLRATLEICQAEIEAKCLEVSMELSASVHGAWADPTRLRQVFWNLLNNSVKFAPPHGQIVVRTSNEGERLKIEVADNGVGIDPEVLPRIFGAFEQGDRSRGRQFGGLGLGLSIAKTIVEMHGGRLLAFSEGVNKGAVFTVDLSATPFVPASEAPVQAPAPGADPLRRILLVEDHVDTLRTMTAILRKWGYSVETAGSVHGALELAARKPFDILVSDLGLPDGSGLQIMKEIKGRYGIHGCALSGYGMDEDIRESHAAGFEAHLTKPVSFQDLRSVLHRLASEAA